MVEEDNSIEEVEMKEEKTEEEVEENMEGKVEKDETDEEKRERGDNEDESKSSGISEQFDARLSALEAVVAVNGMREGTTLKGRLNDLSSCEEKWIDNHIHLTVIKSAALDILDY
mgnify:CR=1 FL=1